MHRRSALLPVCLVGTLLLAGACSGDEETPATPEGTTPAETSAEPGDDASTSAPAPGDDESTTAPAPGDDESTSAPAPGDGVSTTAPAPGDGASTTAPPSGADDEGDEGDEGDDETEGEGENSEGAPAADGTAAVALEELQPRVDRLLLTAADARAASGAEARELRDEAFTKVMRFVTLGEEQVREAEASGPTYDPFVNRLEGNVLAVSQDDGELPWFSLVQTVPSGANPQLTLVRGTDAEDIEQSGIAWSAEMLPGTEVGEFAPRGEGSPLLRGDEVGDLSVSPRKALNDLAGYLDYPHQTPADLTTNGYAPQVRTNAGDQAEAVAGLADLTITNALDEDSVTTLELADGSAIVFAALERDVDLTVTPGSVLTPPDTVSVFIPAGELTEYATVESMVLVAVHLPTDEGRPELIAVSEQVIGAEGD